MSIQRVVIATLAVTAFAAAPAFAKQGNVSGKISSQYSGWAGGQANSDALVSGLRSGSQISLATTDASGRTSSSTFTPATGHQGYGEVKHSLSLAKKSLANQGITQPNAQQMQAALNGGTVTRADGTTVDIKGVSSLRASKMGWGQVAKQYDTNPTANGKSKGKG